MADTPAAQKLEGLPDNAFHELKPGEVYRPIVGAKELVPEVTARSVVLGLLMTIVFSGSIAYLTLKIGTGIEAAIPIAIIAVGLSYVFRRQSTLLENVIIVAIGATSGIVVGGAVFTLPALYIMGLDSHTNLFQLFFIPLLGSVLGVMLLMPLRRYFVQEMHGKFPFPEATATTEVLVAGKKGGRDARVLAYTMAIGGLYDFLASSMVAWRDTFTTEIMSGLATLTTKYKAVFSINIGAAITALGYIMGLRYACIMVAGGALSWFVLIPMFAHIAAMSGNTAVAAMSFTDIFSAYVRPIGIGGIFAAGVVGIVKAIPVMYRAFATGFKELFETKKQHDKEERVVHRTERSIRMYHMVAILLATLVGLWGYFHFSVLAGQPNVWMLGVVALLVTFLLSFLFSSVSAYAIATISTTPISGMTMMTLVIACIVMAKAGLAGSGGMVSVLLIGGVVCTALSMTGSLVTQYKVGYWLGSTPRWIEWSNIAGSIVAAVVTSLVIIMLSKVYGFAPSAAHPHPLPAPQANAMAAVIQGIMVEGQAPWFYYAIGAIIALAMEIVGVMPLAFALGMYLPFDLTVPFLVGALIAEAVRKSARDPKVSERRNQRGVLISSGLIAGGAIMGVIGALLEWLGSEVLHRELLPKFGNDGSIGNWMALGMLAALCAYVYWDSRRAAE